MRFTSILVAAAFAASLAAQPAPRPPAEIRAIAEQGYLFAYPMLLMEFTRRNAAQTNLFAHAPAVPEASAHAVIRPNADTLYSSAWLDLAREPLLLHVPDTRDRYYLMQFLDAWTETFSIPGKRTTGTNEGWFAIVGPGWKGTLPERARRIDSPTNMVWLLGRTQTNGPSDYPNVRAIQRGYNLMPLSLYPDGARAASASAFGRTTAALTPPAQVMALSPAEFFSTFAQLLAANPPHSGDEPMMARLAAIGLRPGQPFRTETFNPEGARALEEGVQTAMRRLTNAEGARGPARNGWTSLSGGRYGADYNTRALVARIGLGANPPEDAVYLNCRIDSSGEPLNGVSRYRLHFDKEQLPPVRAFWSVTMYGPDGYFVPNSINRYAIGDRDPLAFNADGSLDLYIQREAPGRARDVNWLPAPEEAINLSFRLYWPKEEVLNGNWIPPAVVRTP